MTHTDEIKQKIKQRTYSRAHYARHKERLLSERRKGGKYYKPDERIRDPAVYRRYTMKRFGRIYRWIFEHKSNNPCACGEGDPRCLDFDHRDPETKIFNISHIRTLGITDLGLVQEEAAKCDVRCSNCHRKRTATQFDWHSQYKGEL